MYGMYPPPFYGYGPNNQTPPTPSDLERGMKIAMKLREKDLRREEKKKEVETKKKVDERKAAEARSARTFTHLEWFIIGIIMYPIVGPLYNLAIVHLNTMAGVK